jgi:hypothetical protein
MEWIYSKLGRSVVHVQTKASLQHPLYFACANGHVSIAIWLINRGALHVFDEASLTLKLSFGLFRQEVMMSTSHQYIHVWCISMAKVVDSFNYLLLISTVTYRRGLKQSMAILLNSILEEEDDPNFALSFPVVVSRHLPSTEPASSANQTWNVGQISNCSSSSCSSSVKSNHIDRLADYQPLDERRRHALSRRAISYLGAAPVRVFKQIANYLGVPIGLAYHDMRILAYFFEREEP